MAASHAGVKRVITSFFVVFLLACSPGSDEGGLSSGKTTPAEVSSLLEPDPVVVAYEGHDYKVADLCDAFGGEKVLLSACSRIEEGSRMKWLQEQVRFLLRQQIMANEAEAEGLGNTSQLQAQIEMTQREIALREARRIIDERVQPVTEAEIRSDYERNIDRYKIIGSLRFQFIFISTINLETPEEKETARLRSQAAIQELRSGTDFTVVANKYSDATGDKGGEIEEKLGRLNQKIEDALLSLKEGEISDVIPITWGYQILRLIKSTPSRVRPLDEVQNDVRAAIMTRKRNQTEEEFYKELRSDPEISRDIQVNFEVAGDRNAPATAVVFSIGSEKFTVADYRHLYDSFPQMGRRDLDTVKGRNSYLEGVVFKPRLMAYAMSKRGLLERADVKSELDHIRMQILAESWMDKRRRDFESTITFSEAELDAYYNAHPDQFMTPVMYRVDQIRVLADINESMGRAELGRAMEEARNKALEILKEIRRGTPLSAAVQKVCPDDPLVKYWESPLGPMHGYGSELQKELTSVAAPGLINQVIPENGSYLIAEVKEYKPATQQPRAEVPLKIRQILASEAWNVARQKLMDGLLKNEEIQYNDKTLREILEAVPLGEKGQEKDTSS